MKLRIDTRDCLSQTGISSLSPLERQRLANEFSPQLLPGGKFFSFPHTYGESH